MNGHLKVWRRGLFPGFGRALREGAFYTNLALMFELALFRIFAVLAVLRKPVYVSKEGLIENMLFVLIETYAQCKSTRRIRIKSPTSISKEYLPLCSFGKPTFYALNQILFSGRSALFQIWCKNLKGSSSMLVEKVPCMEFTSSPLVFRSCVLAQYSFKCFWP